MHRCIKVALKMSLSKNFFSSLVSLFPLISVAGGEEERKALVGSLTIF
jgi:hypothetical protein